jgi:predicted hotdog family 3-hydroxylacyl-ACP dehydratase
MTLVEPVPDSFSNPEDSLQAGFYLEVDGARVFVPVNPEEPEAVLAAEEHDYVALELTIVIRTNRENGLGMLLSAESFPAFSSGIRAGDVLLAVNDQVIQI